MSARKKKSVEDVEDVEHIALVVSGPEGKCLYIDGYRVAGPKPLGGGKTIAKFTFTDEDLAYAQRTRSLRGDS